MVKHIVFVTSAQLYDFMVNTYARNANTVTMPQKQPGHLSNLYGIYIVPQEYDVTTDVKKRPPPLTIAAFYY